jgi:hypothetical protein
MTSSIRATSHCSVVSKSRHVITSWCVENGAWFICTVFWPNHDLKSCLAYRCIRHAARGDFDTI